MSDIHQPQFTYIISCEGTGMLKFGKSDNTELRLCTLQTGCPLKLSIIWKWQEDIEKEMHSHFADRRKIGEWFIVPIHEAIAVAAILSKEKWRKYAAMLENNR